jgi:ribonuclease VapC
VSAVTFVEASLVLEVRFGLEAVRELDAFLERAGTTIEPVDAAQAREARRAFGRFGRGRHRASLNFGDCFAYALASTVGEPLLFKGDDFPHTDVRPAVPLHATE